MQILRDLIDSTSAATLCVLADQALLKRVSQVQIRQEVLYSSTREDRVSLPQTLQLRIEDGNHIVQEACRRVRSKVCHIVSKRAAGGACLMHALSAEYIQNADPSTNSWTAVKKCTSSSRQSTMSHGGWSLLRAGTACFLQCVAGRLHRSSVGDTMTRGACRLP